MFLGKKVDWDNHGTCPGMMDTCCTKWDPSRRPKKYIKSGRSLGPFPQVQVTSIFVQTILLNKPNLWVRFGRLGSQVQKPRLGLVGFILLRLDIARSFLNVLGQNSGLGQSWDKSWNDGHML